MLLGMRSLSGMHTSYPAIAQIKKFGHALRINTSPGAGSLMLLSSLSIGAAYPDMIQTTSGYALGIGAGLEGLERKSDARML